MLVKEVNTLLAIVKQERGFHGDSVFTKILNDISTVVRRVEDGEAENALYHMLCDIPQQKLMTLASSHLTTKRNMRHICKVLCEYVYKDTSEFLKSKKNTTNKLKSALMSTVQLLYVAGYSTSFGTLDHGSFEESLTRAVAVAAKGRGSRPGGLTSSLLGL